jgi:choline monooxygenase
MLTGERLRAKPLEVGDQLLALRKDATVLEEAGANAALNAFDEGPVFRAEFELEANWKISCENFLECYHCAVAHPGFSAAVDVSPDAYRLEAKGLVSSQVGPLRQNGDSFLANGEVPRSQFHFLWPNFGLNVFPGHPNLSCGPMLPIGPERTARFLDYFFAPDVEQAWIDELLAFDNQVGMEDRGLVEGVQRGVRSGILREGRLLSESEQLVAHFQRLCVEALTG